MIFFSPSRTRVWSSARRIRRGAMSAVHGKRELDGEARPFAALALDSKCTAEIGDALANTDQSQSAAARPDTGCIGWQSHAVVLDRHNDRRRQPLDEDPAGPGLCMPGDVGQRLLDGPIDADLDVNRQALAQPIFDKLCPQAGPVRKLAQIPFERIWKAKVIEDARPKELREITHAAERALGDRP